MIAYAVPLDEAIDVPAPELPVHEVVSLTARERALHRALAGLPAEDRTLICALYGIGQDECSERTAAHRLGVARGTLRDRVTRILRRLRLLCLEEPDLVPEGQLRVIRGGRSRAPLAGSEPDPPAATGVRLAA